MNCGYFKVFAKFWKFFVVLFVPIALIPLPVYVGTQESRCAYVLVLVAVFWMTEALPLEASALIPVFAFPVLGILSTSEVSAAYMNNTNMMCLGGLIIAVSLEHSNLHKRIALFVILHIGQSPRRLMAGFMITTMSLSMWISNSAACAMMIPIVKAILDELFKIGDTKNRDGGGVTQSRYEENSRSLSEIELAERQSGNGINFKLPNIKSEEHCSDSFDEDKTNLTNMYFLATAYACNIGGTGSPLGSGANLVTKSLFESSFEDETYLNFGSWVVFNTPGILINTFLAWVWLQYYFLGSRSNAFTKTSEEKEKSVRNLIVTSYQRLGPVSFHESVIIVLFCSAVLLWLLRSPGFMPGWSAALQSVCGWDLNLKDASVAMLIVILLFIVPSKLNFWPFSKHNIETEQETEGCLTWEVVETKVSWGTVLLLGGGFALAKGSEKSGLSIWLGEQMRAMTIFPPPLIVLFTSLLTALTTEVASNTATSSILMPILKDLSLGMSMNPLYVTVPATACCCYAFILPVATPPNVLVYNSAKMNTSVMMKAGIVMNLICILVVNVMINTLGIVMFDVHNFPSWANSSTTFQSTASS